MIESTVIEQKPPLQSYPKLMRDSTGLIVLFSCHAEGVVVSSGSSGYRVGVQDDEWSMSQFENFHGVVTLQSKPE